MIIAVDAVGGDHYPENPIQGGIQALEELPDLKLQFVGPEDLIKKELSRHDYDSSRVDILNAPEIISMQDSASAVLKEKKNSSISLGLQSHKAGNCHGFVSAGHTGALLTASTVFLGKIEGVYRPTIAAIFPTVNGVRILIDAGANLTLKEEMYYQFAVMGQIFTRDILKVDNPKIGLLNVGEESEKGTELLKASYQKLMELDNFVGNIEGKDILNAKADVFLTDGFTGNVLLKSSEGLATMIYRILKQNIQAKLSRRLGFLFVKPAFGSIRKVLDPRRLNGAILLGLNGIVVKSHGELTKTPILEYAEIAQNETLQVTQPPERYAEAT